jgi:creatinine amidohydrolase/Fe(II)-dependent formamide hydrolase-like protein
MTARFLSSAVVLGLALAAAQPAAAAGPAGSTVYLEDMTSPELRERIAQGATTVLVPIGGTEQNGPYMTLGKHNERAHVLAGEIARQLGNAVVAPVIAYVPEGSIHPPVAHMRFTGTISVPDAVFESVLEATARSFKQHGFRDVFFLGDHGGYQADEEHVAAKLNREWRADPACRVHALTAYYRVTQTSYVDDLKAKGQAAAAIGTHAGLADTALTLATAPQAVRSEALAKATAAPTERDGVHGDPRGASAELGQLGVRRVVESSLAAIRAATAAAR